MNPSLALQANIQPTSNEARLFDGVRAAVVFAFNFSAQSYDRPVVSRLASPSAGTGKGLAGLDGAAQAGMVRAKIKALGPLAEHVLMARFCHHARPCHCQSPCCSGHKPNGEWTKAIAYLSDHLRSTALAGCSSNGLMRRAYVERYFARKEERIGLEALAQKHNVARNTVSAHCARVIKALKQLESTAESAADDCLQAAGLVG